MLVLLHSAELRVSDRVDAFISLRSNLVFISLLLDHTIFPFYSKVTYPIEEKSSYFRLTSCLEMFTGLEDHEKTGYLYSAVFITVSF